MPLFPQVNRILLLAAIGLVPLCAPACGRVGYDPAPTVDDGGLAGSDGADVVGETPAGDAPGVEHGPAHGDVEADQNDVAGDEPRPDPTPAEPPRDAAAPAEAMVVDADCGSCLPRDLTLEGTTPTTLRGTSATPTLDVCPADQVVIGFEGSQARSPQYPWLQSLGALCGDVLVDTVSLAVTTTAAGRLPAHGSAGGIDWMRPCPADQVVVGFDGRDGDYVNQLAFRCARLLITREGTGHAVSTGPVTPLPAVGANAGAVFPSTSCPAGQVARGAGINAASWVNSFALICGRPVVILR
jgi:hypothetical protein